MQNFVFTNPTTIVFGKGQEGQVGALCSELGSRVLILHYGGTFLQDIGLYDGMMASFKEAGLFTMELGGVVSNPQLDLVEEGSGCAGKTTSTACWQWAAAPSLTRPSPLPPA